MHLEPPILVLPNAWDVASAKVLAALPRCRALATSSAAVARSLGFEDGEQAPAGIMIDANGRIAAAVDLPVSGDLEAGYGDPVGTARAAWEAGLVGINFEDSPGDVLLDASEQAGLIGAIRDAVPDLVVNARVDVFLNGSRAPASAVNDPRAAPAGQEAEGPPCEDEQPVLEADQVEEVQSQPEGPGGEAREVQPLDVGDRTRAADRGEVSLVPVVKRLV